MKVETNEIVEFLGDIDFYLSSSGFEERSAFLGKSLLSEKIKKSVIFHIEDTYKISEQNLNEVAKNIKNLEVITYPKNSPLETYDRFYQVIEDFRNVNYKGQALKIVLDITTFTREVLLILIKILSLKPFVDSFNINLVYTPAESYSSGDGEFWLTKGVRDIRSVLGYSGLQLPSKPLLLIVLNGFEEERTNEIIQAFEPNALIIGKPTGSSSINQSLNKISTDKYNSIKEINSAIIIEEFEFSCFDALETSSRVDYIIERFVDGFNIVIAPLNNKISTLGVALSALKNESVQISYASANQYNIASYSESSKYFVVFNLNQLLSSTAANIHKD